MFDVLFARLAQGHRTSAYPAEAPSLSDRFRGAPRLDDAKCEAGCRACIDACPTNAIDTRFALDAGGAPAPRAPGRDTTLALDLGRCLFCTDCVEACPTGAIAYGNDYRLAARAREDLVQRAQTWQVAKALDERARKLFGRSLKLRVVSAAGCNACEADVNVLSTVAFDLGRFGIQVVASPRHADGMVVTGTVNENMRDALRETWEAIPSPKLCIAVGACAISGGPFAGLPEAGSGAAAVVPVDLFVPGCPPHPLTILDGLLRLLGRVDAQGVPARS